ncbi:MAG: hypothetical protein OEZ22_01540 [Spirochaetia bacterium]|nr:hypothetical protein [Spirochaetia bacterium]
MIAVDTNILIYAHRKDNPFQEKARNWLEKIIQTEDSCGIPYHCIIEFHDVRIAALCLENGVSVLYSADRDFTRFPRLKVINPLIE